MTAKESISALATALKVHPTTDTCGDPCIKGRFAPFVENTIHADSPAPTWSVTVSRSSSRGWTVAKTTLSTFMRLVQDGDTEGSFRLDHLPPHAHATLIRRFCGIRKRRELSPDALASLRARGFKPSAGSPETRLKPGSTATGTTIRPKTAPE